MTHGISSVELEEYTASHGCARRRLASTANHVVVLCAAILKQRGEASGLAASLSEIEEHLVPLFDPSRARPPPARSLPGDDG